MTDRARGLVLLFGACSIAGLISGRAVFFNLAYVCAGLLLVSFLWSRMALRGVSVTRRPGGTRSQVGRAFEEAITLVNRSRVPKLWLNCATVGTSGPPRIGRDSRDRRRPRAFAAGPPAACGGSGSGLHADPFGRYGHGPSPGASAVVLPLVSPLPSFPLPSGRLPGGVAVTEPTHQITPNAAGVREYMPGDGFNRIHWMSTARRRRLIVKEFELDPLGDVWLVLDACASARWALPREEGNPRESPFLPRRISLPPSTIEYGVASAASLIHHFLRQDRSVGLLAYDRMRHSIQPDRGAPQLIRALETLAVLDGAGATAVEDVLRIEDTHLTRGAMILVVTASTSSRLVPALRGLRMRSIRRSWC
jgi:uncharacterized protein (DUF58 family)